MGRVRKTVIDEDGNESAVKIVIPQTVTQKIDSDAMVSEKASLQAAPESRRGMGHARTPLHEEIAGSSLVLFNWRWPDAEKDFPQEPWLRNTRLYYPNAKGGGLAVDEPRYENEKVSCKRKQKFLKARGIRYLVYKRGMSLEEALEDIENGMERIGGQGQASGNAIGRPNGQAPSP